MKKSALSSILVVVVLFAVGAIAEAQQKGQKWRVGLILGARMPASYINAFSDGLKEHGYIDGEKIIVEHRPYSDIKQGIEFIAELVRSRVDVLVVTGTGQIRAAMRATKDIPIVMSPSADAVAGGLVDNLAQPGGNVTGLTMITSDLAEKRLQILKETLPSLGRVVAVYPLGSRSTAVPLWLKATETAAKRLKLEFQKLALERAPTTWERQFEATAHEPGSALVVIESGRFISRRKQMAEFAARHRLPTMFSIREHVESGGLLSYGPDLNNVFRQAATYVAKILEGRKPAELPVEQPRKFEFVINLHTAKKIGLTIPQWTLMKADRVIR